MDGQGKRRCRAYRFVFTAVSFGRDEDEALALLIDLLGETAMEAMEEEISFEALDYAYFVRSDLIAES
jgi:hypothetical protein